MPAAADTRTNFSIYVDGRGWAGEAQNFTAPEIVLLMEQWRGGGMDAPIEIELGQELMESSFNMISYRADVLSLVGLSMGNTVPIIARELLESPDGTKTGVVHTMRGTIKSMKPGTSEPGKLQPIEYTVSLTYYKMTHGDRVIYEIDPANMVRVVDGVDQLAEARNILAI